MLILAAFTGAMMVFPSISAWLLSPVTEEQIAPPLPEHLEPPDEQTNWPLVMARAQAAFPSAVPRRLMMPAAEGAPLALRLKQDFEWTPNGRTYVWIDPRTVHVVGVQDPATSDIASTLTEKYYPVHAAKVGGIGWRLFMSFAGLALAMLGLFASWSFWAGRGRAPRRSRS